MQERSMAELEGEILELWDQIQERLPPEERCRIDGQPYPPETACGDSGKGLAP